MDKQQSTFDNLDIPVSAIVEASASGIVVADVRQTDVVVVLVNQAFEQMTGYAREEILGRNCRFLQGDDRDQAARAEIRAALAAGEACKVELRNHRKDGTMFWNEAKLTPLRNEHGEVTHYVGVMDDITQRKLDEQALARSEALYRQVFHDNQAVKLVIEPNTGRILEVNQAACDFYGYSPEEFQAMYIYEINTLSAEEVRAEMQRARRHERNYFEFRHQLASGEIRDVDVFSSPIHTPDGVRLYSIVVDVTGKRETEQARERALANLSVLHEAAVKLLALQDEDRIYSYLGEMLAELLPGTTILVNRTHPDGKTTLQGMYGPGKRYLDTVKQLLGYSPVGQTYDRDPRVIPLFEQGRLVHFEGGLTTLAEEAVPKVVTRQLERLLNLGEIYLIGLRRDDTLYAGVHLYLRQGQRIEQPKLIEALVQQVSLALQRIQAVESLRESERRYRSLFEQSNDAVFLLDLDGRHIEVNHRGAEMLGYHPDEVVGLSYRDIVVPGEHDGSENVLQRLLDGERVPPYERRFQRQDGTTFPVEVNVEVVWGLRGPLHIQSIVRDISERREAEQRAFDAALERERARLLAQFIENASHEFRTPLASINTSAYLMKRLEDPERRANKARVIEQQVTRMTRLVDMLLMMAKLENVQTLSQQVLDLNPLVAGVFDGLSVAEAAGLSLRTELDPQHLKVLGSRDYLVTALEHLLDNAIRHTSSGGSIIVTTGHEPEMVWVEVADDGVGISPEDLPHIFETFWRQDTAHTEPGFGVGLAITQRIVRLHGGDIEVESAPGAGSRFRVWLPSLPSDG